jgi:4-alpha-glucanotransferase
LVSSLSIKERIDPHAPMGMPALDALLETIYASPAMLTILPIQDLFGWADRINTPGTVCDENWTWRLPLPFERITDSHSMQTRIAHLRKIATRTRRFNG